MLNTVKPRKIGCVVKKFPWRFNDNFFKKWSSEMAYALGFIFADGCIFRHKSGHWYLGLYSTDIEILRKIKKILQSNHKIGARRKDKVNKHWKIAYVIQIGNQCMIRDLIKLGVTPRKSLILRFPSMPERFLRHFVRGYFDGDGNVSLGRYWRKARTKFQWEYSTRFTSGSRKFLSELLSILRTRCVTAGFVCEKLRGYELVFSRRDTLALFNFMYQNVIPGCYLARKRRIFDRILKIAYVGP